MMSVEQSYSRLFRPWDVPKNLNGSKSESREYFPQESAKVLCGEVCESSSEKILTPKKKVAESRLRKIRGEYKKHKLNRNSHQDATISTTTADISHTISETELGFQNASPVATLAEYCDRLLPEIESQKPLLAKELKTNIPRSPLPLSTSSSSVTPSGLEKIRENTNSHQSEFILQSSPLLHYSPEVYNPSFLPEMMQPNDIAHALGIPPSDPILLESLAQGYVMELEYARVLHQENEAKLINARKQRPKKYKCPHCQVGFSNNGQLKGHVRIHTGERPYKCDDKACGKTFTRNEELTRHKRIHSGVRPYPCPSCGKKFGRRDHLKKHTRTHLVQAERMMPMFLPLSAVPHMAAFPYLYAY